MLFCFGSTFFSDFYLLFTVADMVNPAFNMRLLRSLGDRRLAERRRQAQFVATSAARSVGGDELPEVNQPPVRVPSPPRLPSPAFAEDKVSRPVPNQRG